MSEYKRIRRELKYKGQLVEFYTDYIELPGEKVVEWDYIHHNGAAAVVPIDKEGNIIMVRQYRNAINRYTLEIPAGGLNNGEDMKECAKRELEEETGYRSEHVEHLIDLYTTFAYCDEKIGIYCATDLIQSKQNLDEDEFLNVEKYSLEDVTAMIFQGGIEDAKSISAILAYKAKFGL